MEFDGVFIPDTMDAGFVIEAFEPDVTVSEGGFAGFDEYFGPRFCITQHQENGGGRVFMHESSVMGRDMNVEYADPFVREHFVMPGFLADLDLGVACGGKTDEREEEKDGLAHAAS